MTNPNSRTPTAHTISLAGYIPGPGRFRGLVYRPDGGDGGAGSGDGGTGDGKGGGAGGDAGKKKPEVSLNGEQLAMFQERFDEAFGKGFAKAEAKVRAELDGQLKALQAEVDKLKKGGKPDGDSKPDGGNPAAKFTQEQVQDAVKEALGPITAELENYKALVGKLRGTELASAIKSAAVKAKVHPDALDDFVTIAERYIKHDDDGAITVLKDDGKPRMNAKAEPMTVEEFAADLLSKKPHFKAGSGTSGGGSHTDGRKAPAGPGGDGKKNPDSVAAAEGALANLFRTQGVPRT